MWRGFSAMMTSLAMLPGVTILGTIDDDSLMIWPSTMRSRMA
ncbi:hypothetical protein J2Z22_001351 [Paenibacillus forsythiae]|uniref:Uncharacterized protein n=1 Tax=Paenibacillus forsythiae TaxID=365616 RepID=A0ABU3H4S7_9BACL|nr:hypothetical protein [Paenibacillus forsythiae]MDT3425832.1 hypothetical protein [Paenibacillus forsythiae]